MKKPKLTPTQKADLLRAHQASANGLKLGTQKSLNKGYSDTPLFFQDKQAKLF